MSHHGIARTNPRRRDQASRSEDHPSALDGNMDAANSRHNHRFTGVHHYALAYLLNRSINLNDEALRRILGEVTQPVEMLSLHLVKG